MSNQYHAFVSHSSQDKDRLVRSLAKDLELQGYKIWFDSQQIEASDDWIKEIEQGVDNSSLLIVVWTENASKSEWVQRELARADLDKKPIIPLIFDDTKVDSILLQRIQYIDFRQGYFNSFQQLVSRLGRLLEDEEKPQPKEASIWRNVKQPLYRSRFLEENHYLDHRSDDFAVNKRTGLLKTDNEQKAENFLTIVTVPFPESINFDFDTLLQLPGVRNDPFIVNVGATSEIWQRFSFSELRTTHTSNNDYLLYKPHYKLWKEVAPTTYIRFDENGNIEYADCDYIGQYIDPNIYQGYIFSLITILATTWKIMGLSSNLYNQMGYDKEFQMLVNIKTAEHGALDGFARDPKGQRYWESRFSIDAFGRRIADNSTGIATDRNIQFVYNINTKALLQNPSVSEDLINDLSKRLQRSFNWKPDYRHYIPETHEFPWNQVYHNVNFPL